MSLLAKGIFATDAASADVNSEKGSMAVFPAENPTRVQHEQWLEVTKPWLTSNGFSALVRGDTLRKNIKLVDRVRLAVPSDAAAAASVAAENAKIDAHNKSNALERVSNENEYKVRHDAFITAALLPKAKLRLKALHKKH